MAQTLRNTVVNRHENLHYVKFDGVSKPVLAGTGLTDWTQAVDPSTDDGQYINEKTSHSNMMAYTPSVSYSGELIPNNEFVRHIYEVGKKEVIGSMFDEYEIETWAPVEGSTGCFAAHHRQYEIQPSNPGSGEDNVATGEFTAGEYDYTTGKFTAASPQSGASSTPGSK